MITFAPYEWRTVYIPQDHNDVVQVSEAANDGLMRLRVERYEDNGAGTMVFMTPDEWDALVSYGNEIAAEIRSRAELKHGG